jgi:ABC-2 type transport system permease protein
MRAQFPSLLRFYVLSTYGLRGRRTAASGEVPTAAEAPAGIKPSAKEVAKAIGIAALAILVVGDIGGIFFATNHAMYQALKTQGLQGLLILNSSITASFLVFFLGFATALSTYTFSTAESYLLSLPVRPRHLLGAKIVTVYLSELLFALLLMGTALGVYAWGEHPPATFYLLGLIGVLALPLLPIAASYLILVPLMSAAKFLRNKNAVMVAGGVVGLAFALGFNFLVQSAVANMGNPAWILAHYAGPDAFLARAGHTWFPALLVWLSLDSAFLPGLGWAFLNLLAGLGVAALAALLLGPAYGASLSRFGEARLRRLRSSRGFIEQAIRRSGQGRALLLREIRLMNREPVYFLNGPFVVLLMPVIIAVAVLAQGESFRALLGGLKGLGDGPWLMLIAAAFGAFVASSTSITCTSISRDAKALPFLKSLPVEPSALALAKFLHGFIFAAFGALVGSLGLGLAMGLGLAKALGALFIGLSLASLVNIGGLWLDTANPRLSWDSPTAALKQNPNAVISILGAMGLIGSLAALAAVLKLSTLAFLVLYGLVPALLAGLALAAYPRYAAKRLAELEV